MTEDKKEVVVVGDIDVTLNSVLETLAEKQGITVIEIEAEPEKVDMVRILGAAGLGRNALISDWDIDDLGFIDDAPSFLQIKQKQRSRRRKKK